MLTIEEQKILKQELTNDEGRRTIMYRDNSPSGNWTVGIGHLCSNVWSDAVIDLLYEEDVTRVYNWLLKSFGWFGELDFPRQYAVISMVFNLGASHTLEFHRFLSAMMAKSYAVATAEMLNSSWAKQVPNRASKLAKIISTGQIPNE